MWIVYAAEKLAGPCFYWGIAIADAIRVAAQMATVGIHGGTLGADDDHID